MKSEPLAGMRYIQTTAQLLGLVLCVALITAATMEVWITFQELLNWNISSAIQDGMLVLILLELVYVVRSFIKYGSINLALIISVGIIATVKTIVLELGTITLEAATAYTMLFVALCVGFVIENHYFNLLINRGHKPRSIREKAEDELHTVIEEDIKHQSTLKS